MDVPPGRRADVRIDDRAVGDHDRQALARVEDRRRPDGIAVDDPGRRRGEMDALARERDKPRIDVGRDRPPRPVERDLHADADVRATARASHYAHEAMRGLGVGSDGREVEDGADRHEVGHDDRGRGRREARLQDVGAGDVLATRTLEGRIERDRATSASFGVEQSDNGRVRVEARDNQSTEPFDATRAAPRMSPTTP